MWICGIIKSHFLWRSYFGLVINKISDPLIFFLSQMDFLKDMTLISRLIILLGGIVVFQNPQLFSSNVSKIYMNVCKYLEQKIILIFFIQQVVYLFLLTVFVPQYLATLRMIVSNPPSYKDVPNVCLAMLIIVLSPLFTYFKHFQMLYLKLKLRELPNEEVMLKVFILSISLLQRNIAKHT